VTSILDEKHGELPKAFVVVKPNIKKSPEMEKDILKFVAGKVVHYKQLRYFEFVDCIPKSPSGKILRRLLRDKEREKQQDKIKELQKSKAKL